MHILQSLFYLMIALHVSGIIVTHLQEHKTTVTTASDDSIYYSVAVTRCCNYSCFVPLKMGDNVTRNM
jgi:lipopolysaccharide export system protein LptC